MRATTATLLLLLCGVITPPVSLAAEPGQGVGGQILMPPPGPYVSSRPQLLPAGQPSRQGTNSLPFMGNMPAAPMRYMPSARQLPPPPPWWYGPMGR